MNWVWQMTEREERLGELKSLATEISSANAIIEEKEDFYLSVVDGKILF